MSHFQGVKGRWTLPRLLVAGASLFALGACNTDKLVAVEDPNQLRPVDVDNIASTPQLVQGAIRQFVGGYSGFGDDAFLSASAVITDEFYYGDTFTTRQAADIRSLQPTALGNLSDNAFSRHQQSRINARRAVAQVTKYTAPSTGAADSATRATLRAFEGYVYVTLSEGWCAAVPFSIVPDTGVVDPSVIQNGSPIGTAEMNDTAVTRFDQALAFNANQNLAKIGKARALLNNAKYALAGASVASVPTTYVYRLEHSANSGSENNPLVALQQNGRYGVANLEGGTTATGTVLRPDLNPPPATGLNAEGLAFRGAADPRIPNILGRNCFTSSIRCFYNQNYPDFDADVPFASGVEARLIEAEAALQANDIPTYLSKLNALRVSSTSLLAVLYPTQKQTFFTSGAVKSLDPLVDPADPTASAASQFAARRAQLFSERAFWLFNTGHRQGDLRRLVRNYNLTTQQVFPSGLFFRGGSYGNDVAYPVPFNEQNNTNFNPSVCSTTTA